MRGEHRLALTPSALMRGSSPHARGAPIGPKAIKRLTGIIPACAGSTPAARSSSGTRRDHPRMRGEHLRVFCLCGIQKGSSPHARGAPSTCGNYGGYWWIIPACAGSTWQVISGHALYKDHPRMRGEHTLSRSCSSTRVGSSPHARGAHFTTSASGQHSRLIHSLFASSSHPSGLSSDYIFARRNTCWHCSNPWKAHRQVSRHQCRSVGE